MASTMPDTSRPAREGGAGCGLPPEQVQAWMDTVRADLLRVQARLAYLHLEELRLAEQHRLLTQLLAATADSR